MMNLFRKKEQPKEQHRPETYAIMAELDNTVKIYDAKGGYKSYGIADKKLKSALVVQNTPFDRLKKVFTVQCSRDGEDFVNTEWGYKNEHRYGIAENLKFPITLNDAFKLANIIARLMLLPKTEIPTSNIGELALIGRRASQRGLAVRLTDISY